MQTSHCKARFKASHCFSFTFSVEVSCYQPLAISLGALRGATRDHFTVESIPVARRLEMKFVQTDRVDNMGRSFPSARRLFVQRLRPYQLDTHFDLSSSLIHDREKQGFS
jgi:hypothetical protein